MSPETAEAAFALLNAAVLPWWVVFLAAPRSRWAARLASHSAVFLSLGVVYGALLVCALAQAAPSTPGPMGLEFWAGLLSRPAVFLAGWTHYLVFDLFVGAWIVREAQRLAWAPRVSLLFTLFAGPVGLAIFLAQRFWRLRTLAQLGERDLA